MKNLRLYRSRLRAVTLCENDKRLQSGLMRSNTMRFPAFGARGSMRAAGRARSVDAAAPQVATSVIPTEKPTALATIPASIGIA